MPETHTEAPSSYPPPAEFAANANATAELYEAAEKDRLAFWANQADRLSWETPFSEVLDWSEAPFAKWFVGGKLNVAYNCVDRHVEAGNGDRVAIQWEGEPVGDALTLTYSDLLAEVCKAANVLTDLGVVAGDRVAIYMPMVPEAIVAMLACARRAARCHAFGGVRRLLGPGAAGPDRGRAGQAGHHHRRAVPPRQGGVAEGGGGRSGSSGHGRRKKPSRARAGGAPHRHRRPVDRRPRPVVARHRRERLTRAHPRSLRRRASTVFALHLGHHRCAEGHHAHHWWLPHPGVVHAPQHLRRQAGNRRVLVHRRHRLGHRAHLRRLRAAVQRRHPGALRGHTQLSERAPPF